MVKLPVVSSDKALNIEYCVCVFFTVSMSKFRMSVVYTYYYYDYTRCVQRCAGQAVVWSAVCSDTGAGIMTAGTHDSCHHDSGSQQLLSSGSVITGTVSRSVSQAACRSFSSKLLLEDAVI